MLAPPNRGSELADLAVRLRPIHRIVGPTALALGTSDASFPNTLGPAEFECGVVAGNRSLNPLGSWLIRDDDDGVVSVASTRLDGMTDWIVVPASHHSLLRSRRRSVIAAVMPLFPQQAPSLLRSDDGYR